jgi:hypothetical protein
VAGKKESRRSIGTGHCCIAWKCGKAGARKGRIPLHLYGFTSFQHASACCVARQAKTWLYTLANRSIRRAKSHAQFVRGLGTGRVRVSSSTRPHGSQLDRPRRGPETTSQQRGVRQRSRDRTRRRGFTLDGTCTRKCGVIEGRHMPRDVPLRSCTSQPALPCRMIG